MFEVRVTTKAKLPKDFTHSVRLGALNATAIKAFLYIVARFQITGATRNLTFKWHDLHQYLSPAEKKALSGRDYQLFREALEALTSIIVIYRHTPPNSKWSRWEYITLVSRVRFDEETGEVSVDLGTHFRHALALIGDDHYTLISLRQAANLGEPRHLRMLVWCYEFLNLRDGEKRRLTLTALRKALGLMDRSYDSWTQLATKLYQYAAVINSKTDLHVALTPIKEGRSVVAVQFDVSLSRRLLKERAK